MPSLKIKQALLAPGTQSMIFAYQLPRQRTSEYLLGKKITGMKITG
jgi:hypothetical protein